MASNTVASDEPQAPQVEPERDALQSIQQAIIETIPPLETYIGTAIHLLEQDIDNPELEAFSQQNHDIFILRANQVGIGLLNRQAYYQATVIYETLIRRVEEFITTSGKARHLGALKANLGVSYILAGNFDAGVSLLLETATRDDVTTYKIDPSASYAITLLHQVILDQVLSYVASMCTPKFNTATGLSLSAEAISTMANHLNPLGDVTLASLIPLIQHSRWQQRASTQYGRVRIMDGLRWLSAMLESMVISIGRSSLDPDTRNRFTNNRIRTLWPAYSNLFHGREWWREAERIQSEGTGGVLVTEVNRDDFPKEIVRNYRQLLSMPEATQEELLRKTVLLSRLTRNFAAHYLEVPGLVVNEVGQDLILYQLLALVVIFDWAYQEGHFSSLAAPSVWPRLRGDTEG